MLSADWAYLPLLTLMNKKQSGGSEGGTMESGNSSEDEVSGVRMCLTWVYVTTAYLDDDPRAAGNIDNYR